MNSINAKKQIIAKGSISEKDQKNLDEFNNNIRKLSDTIATKIANIINRSVSKIKKADDEYEETFVSSWKPNNVDIEAEMSIILKGGKLKNPGLFGGLFNKSPLVPVMVYIAIDYKCNSAPAGVKGQVYAMPIDLETQRVEMDDCTEISDIIALKMLDIYVAMLKKAKKSLMTKFQ